MRRTIALLLGLLMLTVACGEDASPTQAGASPSPTASHSPNERSIAIYSAVIRELIIEGNTFEEGSNPFDVVYVLDMADPNAAETTGGRKNESAKEPISEDVRQGIVDELRDIGPIEFIADGDSVIGDRDGCASVKKNGALVTLGTLPEHGARVKVQIGMFVACLAGTWLTYVVKQRGDDWEVTGTTGPIGIS
jgi:hypothetical protein